MDKNSIINAKAQEEFDGLVQKLRDKGLNIVVIQDEELPDTPDSVFPNNWVSFHGNGTVTMYPMFAENRRLERRESILERIEEEGFIINEIIDYTAAEKDGLYLEGTGSIVMDRVHKKAYCALSPRADEGLFIEFCEDFGYLPIMFTANQSVNGKRLPIYHTNVMMCMGEEFVIICLDSIDNKKEKALVIEQLQENDKEIIVISEAQMHHFAGNMLQAFGENQTKLLILSEQAYHSLEENQIETLRKYNELVYADIQVIETCGGGSTRCMIAEIFLPQEDLNKI